MAETIIDTVPIPAAARRRRPASQHHSLRLGVGLLLLFGLVLAPLRPAAAQAGITLGALTIELWPEYDKPTMLVQLRGTLASNVPLPAAITLHIPAASNGPSAVAVRDGNGQLVEAPFSTSAESAMIAVVLQAQYASFQVEYYDPGLIIDGDSRTYTFRWISDFPVDAASVRVQEPAEASNLKADPPVSLAGSSGLGLNYYTAALGKIDAGQSIVLQLSYLKSTTSLTLDRVGQNALTPTLIQPAAQPEQTSPGLRLSPELLTVGGVSLLGVVVGAGSVWRLVRKRRPTPAGARRTTRTVSAAFASAGPSALGSAQFCTRCGQPVGATHRFCHDCGAPIRPAPPERQVE